MICAYCGGDHSWFYCRTKPEGWKPPKKSTAARKDVQAQYGSADPRLEEQLNVRSRRAGAGTKDPIGQRSSEPGSGTQAPPVDTKSGRPRMEGPSQGKSKRAAYMRDFQRERRAKLKALSGAAK